MSKCDLRGPHTVHLVVDIQGVLSRTDRELKRDHCKWILRDDGSRMTPTELRTELCKELADGRKYLPMGCPTPQDDGDCPGHPLSAGVAS